MCCCDFSKSGGAKVVRLQCVALRLRAVWDLGVVVELKTGGGAGTITELCDMVPTGLANTFVERVAVAAAQRPQ